MKISQTAKEYDEDGEFVYMYVHVKKNKVNFSTFFAYFYYELERFVT